MDRHHLVLDRREFFAVIGATMLSAAGVAQGSNPCLVMVAFSPGFSTHSVSIDLRRFEMTQTRTKNVPFKTAGARSRFRGTFPSLPSSLRPLPNPRFSA